MGAGAPKCCRGSSRHAARFYIFSGRVLCRPLFPLLFSTNETFFFSKKHKRNMIYGWEHIPTSTHARNDVTTYDSPPDVSGTRMQDSLIATQIIKPSTAPYIHLDP